MMTGLHVSQGIFVRHRHGGRDTRHLLNIMTDIKKKEATKEEQGKIQSPKIQLASSNLADTLPLPNNLFEFQVYLWVE